MKVFILSKTYVDEEGYGLPNVRAKIIGVYICEEKASQCMGEKTEHLLLREQGILGNGLTKYLVSESGTRYEIHETELVK